jgi:two-component system, sensor histidine kinase and response regulator
MTSELDPAPAIVMMFTSVDQSDGVTRGRKIGLADWFTKPVKPSRLLHALREALFGRDDDAPSSARRAFRMTTRSLDVLVAEDNAVNARLLRGLLEQGGHRVTVVGDGQAALDELAVRPYDLALVDLQMPQVDGITVAWQVRQREKKTGGYVPLVAVTAHAMKGDRERCLRSGFDGYITKPIRIDELHHIIDNIVPASYGKTAPPSRTFRTFGGIDEEGVGFDREVLLSRAGHDMELAGELVTIFLDELPGWIAEMRQAVVDDDAARLQRVAHTLKGAVGNFGATAAVDLALILERMGRDGDLSDATPVAEELATELCRVEPKLARFAEKLHNPSSEGPEPAALT